MKANPLKIKYLVRFPAMKDPKVGSWRSRSICSPREAVRASGGSLKRAEVDLHLTNSQFALRFRLSLSMVGKCLTMGCLWIRKAGNRVLQAKSGPGVAPGERRAGPVGVTTGLVAPPTPFDCGNYGDFLWRTR